MKAIKQFVEKANTLDLLEIRMGRIVEVSIEPSAPKKSYKMLIDFGKYGKKVSVGRFTNHSIEEVKNKLVIGVLNLGTIKMGEIDSEVLILGVQFPKADSGEATFITPFNDSAKIGGKLF